MSEQGGTENHHWIPFKANFHQVFWHAFVYWLDISLDKCRGRPEGWGSQILSPPGITELVKTMLQGIFGYWSFSISVTVCHVLQRLSANFIFERENSCLRLGLSLQNQE